MDRLRYFGPSLFLAYLAMLCAALTIVSLDFVTLPNPAALVATGMFGMVVTGGLAALIYRVQSNELRYERISTRWDAEGNYRILLRAVTVEGWTLKQTIPNERIEAEVSGTMLSRGEMISILLRDHEVGLVSICDPQIGFSLAGRRRCRQHSEIIKHALIDA